MVWCGRWDPSGESDNSKSEQVRASQSKSEQVRASQSKSSDLRLRRIALLHLVVVDGTQRIYDVRWVGSNGYMMVWCGG
jgi:hypothetical protein